MYKICIKCGFEKAISEFRLFKTKYKSYYRGECMVCEKIYADGNKEKYKIKRDKNKDKFKQQVQKSKQDFPWRKHLYSAKSRCTNPNNDSYNSYGKKGIKFEISDKDGEYLWYRDNGDLMDQPCIDRINSKGNYTVNNCQFLDKVVHDLKTLKEMSIFAKKVIQLERNKTFRKKWSSQTQIINLKGVSWQGLKSALEHNKLYKGFYWVYEKDYKNNA